MSLGCLGGGVLLLDVSVKMEIIDFLQPRIKQKLLKNIIITPEKCVIDIHYVQLSLSFARVMLRAYFGLGPFALDMTIKTTIRGSFLEVDVSEGGGRVQFSSVFYFS